MFRLTHPFLRLLALGALGLAFVEEAGAASPTTILFLGDSLTAGYGLDPDAAYPALVEARLQDAGHEVEVLNGGLSGETTAGGLRRVRWVMRRPIDILVIALGGNDLLRGLPPEQTEANLEAIIETARELQPEIDILLAGMLAPPNMGTAYAEAFAAVFPRLAERHELAFLPFLLEGVAGDPALNQPDGIHPNARGQAVLAAEVAETLIPLLPPR